MAWAYFKKGWCKESKNVTGKQKRRREQKEKT
jgi:hypothetical protein